MPRMNELGMYSHERAGDVLVSVAGQTIRVAREENTMLYVKHSTLSEAVRRLYGTAGHLLKIWFTLKFMGLAVGRVPVEVDTANSTPALKRLFNCGAEDGRFYVPFAHTPRYVTMKHDASRSIVQTTIQRWATSGSVVTCDPTNFLDIHARDDGKLSVSPGRQYPLGLGLGESGFALEDGARVRIPLLAFAAWYGRQSEIPDEADPPRFLVDRVIEDMHISPAERELIFVEEPMEVATSGTILSDSEVFGICAPFIEGTKQPQSELHREEFAVYARRVKSMVSNLDLPQWMRTPPIDEVKKLLGSGIRAILLFGPPRTGKTHIVDSLAPRNSPLRSTIQIHDGWSYDHMIEGFMPDKDGRWNWVDGPLKSAVETGKKVIVLEEINRTLLSQAMGEVFSLIEEKYRGEANGLLLRSGRKFWIPDDCVFFMTMNTVDKSTEDIDDALMGRVAAVECPPRAEDLTDLLIANGVPAELREKIGQLFVQILDVYPLGHGYFAGVSGKLAAEDAIRYYKVRIRPVLLNFLGDLKRPDLAQIDNLVSTLFN